MVVYREVICPYCDKKFMFNKSECNEYYLKDNKKIADVVACTTCNTRLAVFDEKLEGIPEEDLEDNIQRITEYKI